MPFAVSRETDATRARDAANDGGELRFYHGEGGSFTDIAPLGGRLVLFDSFSEHEVLPARRARFALTFWIFADHWDDSAENTTTGR